MMMPCFSNDLLRENGLDPLPLKNMSDLVQQHIAEGWYPGAQLALARCGQILWAAHWGHSRTVPEMLQANQQSLWPMYSGTKVLTAMAIWCLVDQGKLSFSDPVASVLPGFEAHAKGAITVLELLTHQGGFPSSTVSEAGWRTNRAERLSQVCEFKLEWEPGTRTQYHVRGAHWVAACIIEALTGQDYREVILERVLRPCGVADEVFVGVPETLHHRIADSHDAIDSKIIRSATENNAEWRSAGIPASGGYGTATGLARLFQVVLNNGLAVDGTRVWSKRLLEYVLKNRTDEWVDSLFGIAMHRGIGPHVRGTSAAVRTLGSLASPSTFGQGGVGSSMWWADPESGISFAYLSNCRQLEAWHVQRAERISNLVHSAIE